MRRRHQARMTRRHLAQWLLPVVLAAALGAAWAWPGAAAPILAGGLILGGGVALLPFRAGDYRHLATAVEAPEHLPEATADTLARRWGRLHRYWAVLAGLVYLWLAALTLAMPYARAITALFGGALALWVILYRQRRRGSGPH